MLIGIVTPVYNAENYINQAINSFKSQTYQNFKCVIMNDVSTDNTKQVAIKTIDNDNRFNLVNNPSRVGAMCNIAGAVNLLPDVDIIVIVDGDDFLINNKAFELITNEYKKGALVTYGDMINVNGERIKSAEYSQDIKDTNTYRSHWRCNPVRTFSRNLWNYIDTEYYFKMGGWLGETCDQAIMNCMFELSGGRISYIEEPCYQVGMNPRSHGDTQEVCLNHVRSLKPLVYYANMKPYTPPIIDASGNPPRRKPNTNLPKSCIITRVNNRSKRR